MASNNASSATPSGSATSTGGGISFSIAKKSQSSLKGKVEGYGRAGGGREGSKNGEEAEKDFIYSFEEGNIHSSNPVPKKKEYVIPLIRKVKWRVEEGEGGGSGGASETDQVKTDEQMALDKEAAEAILSDLKKAESEEREGDKGQVIPLLLQNKPPVREDGKETGELADLSMRPESSTTEDYDEMPIAEFGKAMLRGMGWKEGTAIGKSNKGMVAPIEFIPRLGKLGLGAAPKPQENPTRRRPGEPKKKVVQGPYIGADGRVKHMRLIGEEIPEQPIQGYKPGNHAKVISGPHTGLYGKIVSADEGKGRVGLQLSINAQFVDIPGAGCLCLHWHSTSDNPASWVTVSDWQSGKREVIDFSQHHLELVSKEEYSKPLARPQSTSKEYGLIKRKGLSGSKEEPFSSKSQPLTSSDDREVQRSGESSENKKRRADTDFNHKKPKRSKHSDRSETQSAKFSGSHSTTETGGSSSGSRGGGEREVSRERLWVAPNLRVRIVDTSFKRGKYYNNKVEILDVVSGDECTCRTADGKHLEGVRQSMLETVVPKTENAAVMIVGGKKHKGQVGRLLERDSKNYKATVELVYSSKVLTVDYDDICEFTGDVDD